MALALMHNINSAHMIRNIFRTTVAMVVLASTAVGQQAQQTQQDTTSRSQAPMSTPATTMPAFGPAKTDTARKARGVMSNQGIPLESKPVQQPTPARKGKAKIDSNATKN